MKEHHHFMSTSFPILFQPPVNTFVKFPNQKEVFLSRVTLQLTREL